MQCAATHTREVKSESVADAPPEPGGKVTTDTQNITFIILQIQGLSSVGHELINIVLPSLIWT